VTGVRQYEFVKEEAKTWLASFSGFEIDKHRHDAMSNSIPGKCTSPLAFFFKIEVFVAPLPIT
jgi:hypothetical protein